MKLKNILTTLLFFVAPFLGIAQNSYSFEETTAAYTPLSGATVIQNPNFGSGDMHLIDLTGETFWFYKLPFKFGGNKTLNLQTNGNLRVDNDSSAIIIDVAFIFLDSIDNNSQISYKIEGASGQKIVKVEWRNLSVRTGQAGNFINIQAWVYQATGVIELRYGTSSANNANGFAQTGANAGANVGIFYAPDNFSKVYEKLWLNNHPSSLVVDTAKSFGFKALTGIPPNGSVYRLKPRFSTVGIGPLLQKPTINLYPNPAQNQLNFDAPLSGSVTDIQGKQLLSFENVEGIDVSSLQAGIYLLKTETGAVARFVKE